jgi:glucan phosphorylase
MTSHEKPQENRPPNGEEELRRQAEELKETVRDRAGSVAETAQQKVSQVADEAGEQARRVAQVAGDEARNMAIERKSQVASQLDSVAQAFRSSGNELRSAQQGSVASYMDRAAEEVNQISHYLNDRSIDEMLTDAEDFARRQPELFLGGAFALGVLAARFFKSSSRVRQHEQGYGWRQQEYALTRQPRPLPAPEATERQRDFARQSRDEW